MHENVLELCRCPHQPLGAQCSLGFSLSPYHLIRIDPSFKRGPGLPHLDISAIVSFQSRFALPSLVRGSFLVALTLASRPHSMWPAHLESSEKRGTTAGDHWALRCSWWFLPLWLRSEEWWGLRGHALHAPMSHQETEPGVPGTESRNRWLGERPLLNTKSSTAFPEDEMDQENKLNRDSLSVFKEHMRNPFVSSQSWHSHRQPILRVTETELSLNIVSSNPSHLSKKKKKTYESSHIRIS